MFYESDVEKMVIETLVKNGWQYIPADQLPRNYTQVVVESMLKDALIRLNPEIAANPSYADEVIIKLRPLFLNVNPGDLVSQNESFKKKIFEENTFPFGKNNSMVPVRFFGTENEIESAKNQYVVTNQWVYPEVDGGKRLDIVLLINGFPMVIGEIKTPTREAISWIDGAEDILNYEKSIPGMFVANVFNFATEGKCYRYGAIHAPVTHWGPWHTAESKKEGSLASIQESIKSMFRPEIMLDLFRYFTLFATDKKYQKYKVVCRYQQYEGANGIINRVLTGYPKQGLIWHFQGSGKSLLMVFAAQKLRMIQELNNATVVIVLDRVDLKSQIFATFSASDVPNLVTAESKKELIEFFKSDTRKVLVTTIYLFDEVTEALNLRDNIIVMVDEAHRTQEGQLGAKMRLGLPNAFFFGLTGTPVNKLDHNTFRTFGSTRDLTGYMSKYSFADSIRDHATLPLNFETVPVEMHINQEAIDEEFEYLTRDLTLTQKNYVSKKIKTEQIIKAPARIKMVCSHIANHFLTKVDPNGFKGQVVCYDRECCVLYKKELDKILGEYATAIVMDTHADKEGKYKDYHRSPDEEAKLLDQFRDPHHPLKLLIVTSKLLTGFDAPILQTMYLDKPMRDHTLLQAICRTNRIYGENKTNGLIVDYIGIFDKFAQALSFDEKGIETVITNIDKVKNELPRLLEKCLQYFPGVDRTADGWEELATAQECLPTDQIRDRFATDYRVLHRIWNMLSPDRFLDPFARDYRWLSMVYESVRPVDADVGHLVWSALGPKTLELIQKNIDVTGLKTDLEVLETDADIIEEFINSKKTDNKKIEKRIEISLRAILRGKLDDPVFIKLGQRLEALKRQYEQGVLDSINFLKGLLDIARDTVEAIKGSPKKIEIDKGRAALTELFYSVKDHQTPIVIERIVNEIDDIVKVVRFPGWQETRQGCIDVSKAVRSIFIRRRMIDKDLFDKAYGYVKQYY